MNEQNTDAVLAALAENFDHISPEFRDNRREFYQYIHASGCPVRRSENHGGFTYVARHETALAVLRNTEVFSNMRYTVPERPVPAMIPSTLDPPLHLAYKQMLTRLFSPRTAARLRPRLSAIANDLIASGLRAGRFDIVQDVMFPLMGEFTMGDMLGLDPAKAFAYAQPMHHMTRRDYPAAQAKEELDWLIGEMTADISEGRVHPDGILSELMQVDFSGRKLSVDELTMIALNLLVGGMGTTSYFMGSVAVFLARNPEHRRQLIETPTLMASAIDELLRVYTPTQSFGRLVTRDTVIEGVAAYAGEKVLIGYGAANFDPAVFKDPNKVDFGRSPDLHLSFGVGAHRCLGLHIAKDILATVTRTLLEQAPDYVLVDDDVVEQGPAASMFGYSHVPVMATESARR